MKTADEIRSIIASLKEANKHTILESIKEGDVIKKAPDHFILVDDVDLVWALCGHPDGVSVSKIRAAFPKHPTTFAMLTYYEQKGRRDGHAVIVSLSNCLKDGMGECAEMAVCAKLLAQRRKRESYYVAGTHQDEDFGVGHAWVMVGYADAFYLFDPSLEVAGARILDIINTGGYWHLVLEGETKPQYYFI